jgi:diguanylate cyclase (GGDEF)-like protein
LPAAVLFVACGMTWNAARIFHNRPVMWPAMLAGTAIWLAACTLPGFPPMGASRFVLASVIIALYSFLTAAELWRERRRSLVGRPALFAPALHGIVFLFPIAVASLVPEKSGLITLATAWLAVFVLEMLLYAVGTAFLVLELAKERTLRAHKSAALTDPLTGLFNRRGFAEACSRVIEREAIAGRPVTVMIFDIDHFKSINDRFGHPAGDEILKLFAVVIASNLRLSDLSGRIGGEEFAALLPCSLEEGVIVADRMRQVFENSNIVCEEGPVDTTVSIGVAGGPAGTELEVLLAAADTALYQAKRTGRNKVEAAEELPLSLENWRRKSAGLPETERVKPAAA